MREDQQRAEARGAGAPLTAVLVISNLEYGGAQRQVVELANHADPSRFRIHICSLSSYVPLAAELADRRNLQVIEKHAKYDLSVVPRLTAYLRRVKPDVVQSYLFDADIAVRLAGRLARVPLVVGSERNTDYYLKPVQLKAYRLTRSMVDLVIANSGAGAQFNARTLGHPEGTYRVVHNGVNTSKFQPVPRDAARAELGLPTGVPIVGMFASFKEQKNHPLFFAAVKHLRKTVPDVRLLFVGDQLFGGMHGSDAYKDRVEAMIDDLGLRDACIMLGNRDDVARIYPACDVTVLPSLYEGTPNVALESMACGVPVVVTNVSDNALIVPDGRAGAVVELNDEIALADRLARILTNPQLRQQMGDYARRWAEEQFSSRRLAEKTEAVFRAALRLPPAKPSAIQ